ncbi:MAG TPA: hypothetical protein VG826_18710 [Pirellulales bacterium]|nr:hypothetical protein [Pirellulales bacterium]
MNYWAAWIIAVFIQWQLSRKEIHSQYGGRPVIAHILVKDEGTAKLIVEPVICLAAGYGLLGWSDVLGKLVMSAAGSLLFLENYYKHSRQQREREVIDARIEAEALNQGMRERLGDYR